MTDFVDIDLAALERLNRLRAAGATPKLAEREELFEERFQAGSRLAVYGSLAPGRSNHNQLSGISGEWIAGLSVRGELKDLGWGVHLGFPALRCSESAPEVPVELFVSSELPRHWQRLDRFEGPDYLRILVPVLRDGIVVAVANLYEVVEPGNADATRGRPRDDGEARPGSGSVGWPDRMRG